MISESELNEKGNVPLENVETKLPLKEENIGFNHKCAECSRFFQTRKQWRDHSRNHRRKLCSLCNKAFRGSYLQAHMEICTDIQVKREAGKFICDICNHESTTQKRLGNHLIRKHNPKPPLKVHHCEFCEYQSEKRCMVRRHEKTCKEKYENIIFI